MPTDVPFVTGPRDGRLKDMQASMEELNARIARLAIGLGVSLKNDEDVARVLSWRPRLPPGYERRRVGNFDAIAGMIAGRERRVAHRWNELRGLLALRYSVETRYVDAVGASATRRIMVEAERHLVIKGFHPGDDGVDFGNLG